MEQLNAIQRLRKSGLSRADIRTATGATRQAVGLWESGRRVPGRDYMAALVKLAESRGITLLAADFIGSEAGQ